MYRWIYVHQPHHLTLYCTRYTPPHPVLYPLYTTLPCTVLAIHHLTLYCTRYTPPHPVLYSLYTTSPCTVLPIHHLTLYCTPYTPPHPVLYSLYTTSPCTVPTIHHLTLYCTPYTPPHPAIGMLFVVDWCSLSDVLVELSGLYPAKHVLCWPQGRITAEHYHVQYTVVELGVCRHVVNALRNLVLSEEQ